MSRTRSGRVRKPWFLSRKPGFLGFEPKPGVLPGFLRIHAETSKTMVFDDFRPISDPPDRTGSTRSGTRPDPVWTRSVPRPPGQTPTLPAQTRSVRVRPGGQAGPTDPARVRSDQDRVPAQTRSWSGVQTRPVSTGPGGLPTGPDRSGRGRPASGVQTVDVINQPEVDPPPFRQDWESAESWVSRGQTIIVGGIDSV